MWYRFSKVKWVWDITDGIDYTYAYVKAHKRSRVNKPGNLPAESRKAGNLTAAPDVTTISFSQE